MPRPAPPRPTRWAAALLLVTALSPAGFAADDAPPTAETTWGVIELGGDRIGWTRTAVTPLTGQTFGGETVAGTRTAVETEMTFRRFGQTIKMGVDLTTEETAEGVLNSYVLVTRNPGAAPTRTAGVRDGEVMRLTAEVNGKRSTREVPVPADVKGPAYLERLLDSGAAAAGSPASYPTFFPDLEKAGVTTVSVAESPAPVETPAGETVDLTAVTLSHDVLPIDTVLYLDADGEAVFDRTNLLGQSMVTYEVDEAEALRAVFGKGADIGFDTLVEVPAVPDVHSTQVLVYDAAVAGADAAVLFPTAASQRVEPQPGGRARVTVTALPVPPAATAGADPARLTSTRYLQADDPRVIAHANAAAPAGAPAGAVAAGCAAYVKRTLTNKNFSTALASAAEVAEKLAGDCTEHSVLCAAMLRARGVPARVCVGLVTIPGRGQMGGHMWVEALLDADGPDGDAEPLWVPLDPTITGGAIGGGHLLLSRSDLSDEDDSPVAEFLPMLEVIGKLTLDVTVPETAVPEQAE